MMTAGVAKYNEYIHQKELSGEDVLDIIFEPKPEWKPDNGFGVEEYINAIHPKIPGKKRQGQVALLHRVGDGEDGEQDARDTDEAGWRKPLIATMRMATGTVVDRP